MNLHEVIEEAEDYLEEIASKEEFPFSDGSLISRSVEDSFNFGFNYEDGSPRALIYGRSLGDTVKIGYGFELGYGDVKVEDADSAIEIINLALDHILTEMNYPQKDQYFNSGPLHPEIDRV